MDKRTLTEKWKDGKLEEEQYYVRNPFLGSGAIGKLESKDNCLYFPHSYVFTSDSETQILAPVPSYDEYLESEAHCAVYSEENKVLQEKIKLATTVINTVLKESQDGIDGGLAMWLFTVLEKLRNE